MGVGSDESCPLPPNDVLAEVATAMQDAGEAAWIFDAGWRFAYVTDDARSLWVDRDGGRLGSVAIGHHIFSTESLRVGTNWHFGLCTVALWRDAVRSLGGLVLADTDGGRDALASRVDPAVRDVVDELVPCGAAARSYGITAMGLPGPVPSLMVAMRVRDERGTLCGTVLIGKPTAPMSVLGGMAWQRDLDHLGRMERFTRAGRHPMAILFADLQRSSELTRTLSTAAYFTLGRRLVRAADQCVVDAGGLVGRHLGDGVVAFFPAETSGSESAAARACLTAARSLRPALHDVATRSGLPPDALVVRFGLHWGSEVFIGKISTVARAEVTALGDEVNVAARLEECAPGGSILASRDLVDRLEPGDADALGLDPQLLGFTKVDDLATATVKARRDAPGVAVCEL